MTHTWLRFVVSASILLAWAGAARADAPKPSPFPVSWQLKIDYQSPKRIVVNHAGGAKAYWYLTFTVTNPSDREQRFLPVFEMLTKDDKVLRSDQQIQGDVIQTIRRVEKSPRLQALSDLAGTIRIGEDQAREGVAIWLEPDPRMSNFTIFIGGLSGESVILTDKDGKAVEETDKDGKKTPVVLWKTLKLDIHIAGDEKFPGIDVVDLLTQEWVMR